VEGRTLRRPDLVPTIGWACGTTNETTRDTVQRTLVGRSGHYGTGAIPKDAIIEAVSANLDVVEQRPTVSDIPNSGVKVSHTGA
jgi:hypothetical protein